jgi:hypothetical protein
MLGLPALLAAAVAAAPAVAQDKEKLTDSQKLEEIQKQLADIQRALVALYNVPTKLGDAETNLARAQKDINDLKEQTSRLQRDLEELRRQVGATTRIAGFPPTGGTGRIRLMNTYTTPMSIRINDRVYRLEPGQTQVLEAQPAGPFTYEVMGVQPPVSRVLGANETYTIYVYPR